jgi:acyl-CoA thioester hydrolase
MTKSDYNFFFPLRVRFAETDDQGVVYNSHYLTYFDTTIYEYFRDLPYSVVEHVKRTGTDFYVVRIAIDFFGPSRFDDEIEVHLRTARIGRSSMTFLSEIYPTDDDTALVKGEIIWVNADVKTQKSAPLPQELLARLKTKEGAGIRGQ